MLKEDKSDQAGVQAIKDGYEATKELYAEIERLTTHVEWL
jgi:hypothetical protein